jgi:plastocyanin
VLRRSLVILATAALAAAVAAAALGRPAATPKLTGRVGPGFSISLKQGGKKVTTLTPGAYSFVVTDKASIHSFVLERLTGGKFEKTLTSVAFTGTKSAKITLGKGKWKYYCKPHESIMFGNFTVK